MSKLPPKPISKPVSEVLPPKPWPEPKTVLSDKTAPPKPVTPSCSNCDACVADVKPHHTTKMLRCYANPPQIIAPSPDFSAWPPVPPTGWCRQHKFAEVIK